MSKYLTLAPLALLALGAPSVAKAAGCGDVSIAVMNVQSAEVLAYVDKTILSKGYGCNVEFVPGDTVPTVTSMVEKGKPDISPETWVDLVPDLVARGMASGKIETAAPALTDGGVSGWWIPKYLADAHPEIKTIADVVKHPELFPAPEDPSKGAVINGAQGWGDTIITSQLFKALAAQSKDFVLVDPGSAAGLDGAIAKDYERKTGFVSYYWAPTSLLGKYDLVKLGYPTSYDAAEWKRCTTNPDCPDPKLNAWPTSKVFTVVTTAFAKKAPADVMAYLDKRGWSNDTVGKLLNWETSNQATGEEGAAHFMKSNPDVWKAWVPADVAAKIQASM